MRLTPPERRLRTVLRVLVFVFLAAVIAYASGPLIPAFAGFFQRLPFVSNSVVKVSLMGLICLFAAGDVRRRHGLVLIFVLAHVVSVAAMVILLPLADTGRMVEIFGSTMPVRNVLWGAIALDGALTLLVLLFYVPARRAMKALHRSPVSVAAGPVLSRGERWLKGALVGLGALFALAAIGYEVGPLLAVTTDIFVELPFVTNSVVKVGALAMLCFFVAADMRRQMAVTSIVIWAHVVSALMQLIYVLAADTGYMAQIGGTTLGMSQILWSSIALDAVIAAGLFGLYQAAWNARFRPAFLRPTEYRTLIALADVLVRGAEEAVPPEEIAANVDTYVSRIRARRRWVYRVALFVLWLHPLLYFKAPMSELDEELRLAHLKKHFLRDVIRGVLPDFVRRFVQVVIRVAKQLTYVGYYNDPRAFAEVGYVPFSQRERARELDIPERRPHPLEVQTPGRMTETELEADICIVGSGAAGAILAYNLARAGHDVLVVERGRYVEPRDFSEDEVEMIGKLYADGIFQQTEDYRFTVLQGSCVGGTTVVNNAVCFDPPERVLNHWNDPTLHDAGLQLAELWESVEAVNDFVRVQSQRGAPLNPSYPKFTEGLERFQRGLREAGIEPQRYEVDAVRANIEGCFGCGYCNIGCAYGKKLSMLDTALPWGQRDFPGKLRIVAECEVERIRTLSGPTRRVLDLEARLSDGRKVRVRGRTYVLAAGTIASSYLLMRSGVGRGLPVGKGVCFNMGSPLTAEFDDEMNAYDGLQISHYGLPDEGRGFVYETWWNPPVAQAINMPGWFEGHFENMRRYPHLMAVGVLVGSERNGRVVQALTGGADISYVPTQGDLRKLGEGLKELGHILFAAGANRLLLNTWGFDDITDPDRLDRIDEIVADPSYITLGTGHPQGGNALSKDPRRGVVGPDFRVHGYGNLYVCDASVFPSSLTVNPQLTVMALAHYAASRIARGRGT